MESNLTEEALKAMKNGAVFSWGTNRYCHLDEGQEYNQGQVFGICEDTGIYTMSRSRYLSGWRFLCLEEDFKVEGENEELKEQLARYKRTHSETP